MADLRIPPNQIVSKYSSGNEYMFVTTYNDFLVTHPLDPAT